jgi:hypothetical protein
MKRNPFLAGLAATAILAGGALFATQDQQEDPSMVGVRKATSTIEVDASGDSIALAYNTLQFSQVQIDRMKESAEARQAWAKFLPQRLGATLTTEVALTYQGAREYVLPAGNYNVSFGMTEDGAWELLLFSGQRRVAHIKIATSAAATPSDFMAMNLMSAGADAFKLGVTYGNIAAVVPFGIQKKAESAEGEK